MYRQDNGLRGEPAPSQAQKAEQFKQRQPENSKIIALDVRKELDPSSLESTGADRSEYRRLFGAEICVEKRFAEAPHVSFADMAVCQIGALSKTTSGSDKLVGPAAQNLKLSPCVRKDRRVCETNCRPTQ